MTHGISKLLMASFLLVFLAILAQYGVVCDFHGNKRFIFNPSPATQTSPDPAFMAVELQYLREEVHRLGDTNIHLSVQNSMLTSQVQSQTAQIQILKTNLTNLENLRIHENGVFVDKINKMDAMVNDSKALVAGLTRNVSSCLLNNNQLEEALIRTNNKTSLLEKKLNDSLVIQNMAVQTAVEQCRQNESALTQHLQVNISSLQLNCSHQLLLLTDNVHQLQTETNSLMANWTSCVNLNYQLQSTINASQNRNQVLDQKLHDLRIERDNLSLALLQCHGPRRDCGLDLVFLVDESGSVGQDNFDILKDFMNRIIQHLNIGPRDNQVGIATYASTAQREFDLDSYSTKTSLIHAVRNISYNHSGLSFVSRGLRLVANHFFNGTHGDRANHPNVLIILTDGDPLDPSRAKLEASSLESRGVEIFVVGISRDGTNRNLIDLATDSSHILPFLDFGDLDGPAFAQESIHKLMAACQTV